MIPAAVAPQTLIQLVTPDRAFIILADRNVAPAQKYQAIAGCFEWFRVQRERDAADYDNAKAEYQREIASLRTQLEQANKAAQDVQGQLGTANGNIQRLETSLGNKERQIRTLEDQRRTNQERIDADMERLNKKIRDQEAAEAKVKRDQDENAKKLRQARTDKITADLKKERSKFDPKTNTSLSFPFTTNASSIECQFNKNAVVYYNNVLIAFNRFCSQGMEPDEALRRAYSSIKRPKIGWLGVYY